MSRRIAVNGAVFIGWVPLLSWFPGPWWGLPRADALVCSALAGLVAWTSGAPAVRLPRLIPHARYWDVAIPATAGLAALTARPLFAGQRADEMLGKLLVGWDNASHFAMYLNHRVAGVAPPFDSPPPPGDAWFFGSYPQHFHALLALLTELRYGAAAENPPQELLHYGYSVAVAFIVICVVGVAAVLHCVRTHPLAPLGAVTAVWSLLIGAPGARILLDGHLGFLVSATAVGLVALLLSGPRDEEPPLLTLLPLTGLLVVSAQWLPLLPLAFVTFAAGGYRLVLRAHSRNRAWAPLLSALTVALLSLVVYGCLTGPVSQYLAADGAVFSTNFLATALVPLAVLAMSGVALLLHRKRVHRWGEVFRKPQVGGPFQLGALSSVGVVMSAALWAYQTQTSGELTYYYWKFALGVQTAVLLAALAPMAKLYESNGSRFFNGLSDSRRGSLWSRFITCGVVLSAMLGLGALAREHWLPSAMWPFATAARWDVAARDTHGAARILAAAEWATVPGTLPPAPSAQVSSASVEARPAPSTALHMTLVATLPDDASPALANAWFHALTMTRTVGAASPDSTLHALTQDRSDSALARAIEQGLAGPYASVLLTDRAALEGALRHDPRLPVHRVEVLEVK